MADALPEGLSWGTAEKKEDTLPEGLRFQEEPKSNFFQNFAGGAAESQGAGLINAAAGKQILGGQKPFNETLGGTVGYGVGSVLPWSLAGRTLGATYGLFNSARTLAQQQGIVTRYFAQMGRANPVDDMFMGGVSGVGAYGGGELAENYLGEEGRIAGEVVGGIVSGAPASMVANWVRRSTNVAKKLFEEALPDDELMEGAVRSLYQGLDDAGVVVPSEAFKSRLHGFASETFVDLAPENVAPNARAIRNLLELADEGRLTYGYLNRTVSALRSQAGDDTAGKQLKSLARIVEQGMFDAGDAAGTVINGRTVRETVETAANGYQRLMTARAIQAEIEDAATMTFSGPRATQDFEAAISTRLRKLISNGDGGQGAFMSDMQKQLVRDVIQGGHLERRLRALDVLGVNSQDFVRTMLVGAVVGGQMGAQQGAVAGLGAGAAALLAGTAISRAAQKKADSLFRANLQMAPALVRAGGNAREIMKEYMRTTKGPKKAEDLALLMIHQGADVEGLAKTKFVRDNKLYSDAVILAQVGMQIKLREEAEAEEAARREAIANYNTANDTPQLPNGY